METSVNLLERLAGAPTDDDWRRLDRRAVARMRARKGEVRARLMGEQP